MLADAIQSLGRRVLRRPKGRPTPRRSLDPGVLDALAARDYWFWQHFAWAPEIIVDHLRRVVPLESARVFDFGCGEGLMAKGVALVAREVHGVDIVPKFEGLEERFDAAFGPENRLPSVDLRLVEPGKRLAYRDGYFDAAFAWSVFEHVHDTPQALREIHRVLRPGGGFHLIINPLYYSARGAHLWHVLDEPWIHLKLTKDELLERIRAAEMSPESEVEAGRTDIYQGRTAEGYRTCVMRCLDSLNMLTVDQLVRHAREAGFTIVHQETKQTLPFEPPPELLARYPREDLMTDEVTLLMRR